MKPLGGGTKASGLAKYENGLTQETIDAKVVEKRMQYGAECAKCGAVRVDKQLGLEKTPEEFVAKMVAVFEEVRRVLKSDGTCWVNLGDSYAASRSYQVTDNKNPAVATGHESRCKPPAGLKSKDLVGIPWAVAKALQEPKYQGLILKDRDRVWLAAILDAEGSICGFHHTRKDTGDTRTGIHITITNTNFELLAEAQRIWPTSREDGNAHGPSALGLRECRRWIAHNVDSKAALLREVYPYLIAKKQQALLAWNFLEMSRIAKRIGKGAEGPECKEKRSRLVHLISALNRGLQVDLPDWIEEPETLFTPGWYLRSDIIWSKPNPMPESVTDRPTKSHEYLFLLTKGEQYYYDQEAILEDCSPNTHARLAQNVAAQIGSHRANGGSKTNGPMKAVRRGKEANPDPQNKASSSLREATLMPVTRRNKRTVWTVPTFSYSDAHFATYPPDLIKPCILAGSRPGDTILDPFGGSGTTGQVALELGRRALLIELNPEYVALIEQRCNVTPGLGF